MGCKKGIEFYESPPDFYPENPYKDPIALLKMREHIVREKWTYIQKAIICEKLRCFYLIEGVNHVQKCKNLVQRYLNSTRGIGSLKDGHHPDLYGSKVVVTTTKE